MILFTHFVWFCAGMLVLALIEDLNRRIRLDTRAIQLVKRNKQLNPEWKGWSDPRL